MGQRKSSRVEIGSGEDGHYDWIAEFSILEDIETLLVEMESVERALQGRQLSVFLTDLRKQYSEIPKLEYLANGFDLIRDHPNVCVESEFFDPDMPVSSIGEKVYVDRSDIPNLIEILKAAKEGLEEICERGGISELLNHREEEIARQRQGQKDEEYKHRLEQIQEDKKRQKTDEDEWVEDMFLRVCEAVEQRSEIAHIEQFLIDPVAKEIFVLTVHKNYRQNRSGRELRTTQKLKERFKVYEIEESSPPNSGHIPYFAGALRQNVMGWSQSKSVLFSSDSEGLRRASLVRERYVDSLDQ